MLINLRKIKNQITNESYDNSIRIFPFWMFQQTNNETKTAKYSNNSNQTNPIIIKNER